MSKQNQYIPQSVPHPGITLEEKLEEMDMGPKEFAVRSGKPEKTITAILKGESSITPDMAVQFEHVTRIPAHLWLNLQRTYDEYIAREKRKALIAESLDWAACFPVADMLRKGWLSAHKTGPDRAEALLAFFGFANHKAWAGYYFGQQLKVAFRISLAHIHEPYAISAWLRRGELQAAGLQARAYSEKDFREALPILKSIMAHQPADFFAQLQGICLQAGVKVVYTPCLPKAPISGATRWLHETPLIQLSGHYKRNDIFWFTFFHEAGHILLHGKKDIFLEEIEYADKNAAKEKEADAFAVRWTLSESEEEEILSAGRLDMHSLHSFAQKFDTHPALIIGRLQHKKLLPYSFGKEFFRQIKLD